MELLEIIGIAMSEYYNNKKRIKEVYIKMVNVSKGTPVINSNDLTIKLINGTYMAIAPIVYVVESSESEDGYIKVKCMKDDKIMYLREDFIVPVNNYD